MKNDHEEFMKRSAEDVYLAIMDKLKVKIDFSNQPDERPIWRAAALKRGDFPPPMHINCRCSIRPIIKK